MSQRHLLHLPSGTPFRVFHSNTQWLDPLPDPSVSAGQSLYEPCLSHSMAAGKQEPSLAQMASSYLFTEPPGHYLVGEVRRQVEDA